MTLRAVFLDVGNTLLYEIPSRFEIYARAARRRGVEVDASEMTRLMRLAHAELPREVEGSFRYSDPWFRVYVRRIFVEHLGLAPAALPGLLEELFAAFEDPQTFGLHEGARELMREARARGLRLGIVSNWSARLPRVLAGLGIDDAVDFVLCSALERIEKPEPAIFRAALEHAEVAPEEALHAGDHLRNDVQAAQELGIEGVLVDHSGRFRDDPELGCRRVHGLPELTTYILSRTGTG